VPHLLANTAATGQSSPRLLALACDTAHAKFLLQQMVSRGRRQGQPCTNQLGTAGLSKTSEASANRTGVVFILAEKDDVRLAYRAAMMQEFAGRHSRQASSQVCKEGITLWMKQTLLLKLQLLWSLLHLGLSCCRTATAARRHLIVFNCSDCQQLGKLLLAPHLCHTENTMD
jgi:hypothetical protein